MITEGAYHAKLKQEVSKLWEQLANTTDTTSTLEGNVNQLYANQRKMAQLTVEVAPETENAMISDVNTLANQVAAILLSDGKMTTDGSNTNKCKVKLPL